MEPFGNRWATCAYMVHGLGKDATRNEGRAAWKELIMADSKEVRLDAYAEDDLRRIEDEVRQEAIASVEDFDAMGDAQAAAEAAETAFAFETAEGASDKIEAEVEKRLS